MASQQRLGGRLAVAAVVALVGLGVLLRAQFPRRRAALQPTPAVAQQRQTFELTDVGPRLLSNQTSTPVLVMGHGLAAGDLLVLGLPARLEVPLSAADGERGWARLPAIDLPASTDEANVQVTLRRREGTPATGQARLTVANDLHFPDPVGLAFAQGAACAISTPTDELCCWIAGSRDPGPKKVALGDGPSAIASGLSNGRAAFLIGHQFLPELWLVDAVTFAVQKIPGPLGVTGIAWDSTVGVAYVAEHVRNQLWAISLGPGEATGKVLWTAALDPGPGLVRLAGAQVAVGSKQTGEVQLVRRSDGALEATVAPLPGMPIVGGHTAPYANRIMGGLAVRDLAYAPKLGLLFEASCGPNIGPNPEKMEVSQNGGVSVIDPSNKQVRYHLGFGAGVTESLALDEAAGLLYASDVALGQVRVLDLKKLAAGPAGAEGALLATVAIPPPATFPLVLPADQLGLVKGHGPRAGVELHSGPKALVLGNGIAQGQLLALDRLSGTLARFRIGRHGALKLAAQEPLFDPLTQVQRRQGEVLYYSDVGRSGMSCDACHVDGHVGGILFSKTKPMRLYRATSVRGARETPPYFIPGSEQSLASTASFVGSRNRYQNPAMSRPEIDALARFCSEIPTPPNPFVSADGSPPDTLILPDGASGSPKAGAQLFFGKARCQVCHPGPLFTTDQSPTTQGRYLPAGTPALFPLHPELQEGGRPDFPAQSLSGIWDLFPLLTTGAAGLAVKDGQLQVATRFPLREVLERQGPIPHGQTAGLSPSERNDLLAFLLTL